MDKRHIKKVPTIPMTREPKKSVAIYCRVSTEFESQEESSEAQTNILNLMEREDLS